MARPRVEAPSVDEFFQLVCSEPVKIFIGPQAKCYIIPKDLLCYWSPYFQACFTGGFKESVEGELRLAEENPAFFEVFLEYCRKGQASYKPDTLAHRSLQLQSCISFIKFCDKYDLGQVVDAAEVALRRLLRCGESEYLDPDDVSQLANSLDQDSKVFKLLMQACLRETLREGAVTVPSMAPFPHQKKFSTLMREDDAVAAGMMRELVVQRQGEKKWVFTCPPLLHWKAWDFPDELCAPESAYPTLEARMERLKEIRKQEEFEEFLLSLGV